MNKLFECIINRNNSVDYVVGPQNIQVIPTLLKKKDFEKVHIDFLSEEKFKSLTFSQSNKNFKINYCPRGLR